MQNEPGRSLVVDSDGAADEIYQAGPSCSKEQTDGLAGAEDNNLAVGMDKSVSYKKPNDLMNIASDDGRECPICFSEYTTGGEHRILSTKCGHLFGKICLEKWMRNDKKSSCPSCSSQINKRDLRSIYVNSVRAVDEKTHEKLLGKYLIECEHVKELYREIRLLKTEIETYKLSRRDRDYTFGKGNCAVNRNRVGSKINFSNFSLKTSKKINFLPKNSKMVFDRINSMVVISSDLKNSRCGILNFYSIDNFLDNNSNSCGGPENFAENFHTKFPGRIADLKPSPHNDGLCLIGYNETVVIYNPKNKNIIFSMSLSKTISVVNFDLCSRNKIFVGLADGEIHMIDIYSQKALRLKISALPITGISQIQQNGNRTGINEDFSNGSGENTACGNDLHSSASLIVTTLFDVYSIKMSKVAALFSERVKDSAGMEERSHLENITDSDVLVPLNKEKIGVVTGISGYRDRVLITIRNSENNISAFLVKENDHGISYLGIKQNEKYFNKIYQDFACFVRNTLQPNTGLNGPWCGSSLEIFDTLNNYQPAWSFKISKDFKIIDFYLDEEFFFVLTERRIEIYTIH